MPSSRLRKDLPGTITWFWINLAGTACGLSSFSRDQHEPGGDDILLDPSNQRSTGHPVAVLQFQIGPGKRASKRSLSACIPSDFVNHRFECVSCGCQIRGLPGSSLNLGCRNLESQADQALLGFGGQRPALRDLLLCRFTFSCASTPGRALREPESRARASWRCEKLLTPPAPAALRERMALFNRKFRQNLVFAAFLAGFAVVHKKRQPFSEALDAVGKVSFAFFIPLYFALVGLKLDLIRGFSLWMIAAFMIGSCVVKIFSVGLAGRFAGFHGLDLLNLAITTNARGGPGIVLASVAFDAGIISPEFYTTLVLVAVITSTGRRRLARLRAAQRLATLSPTDTNSPATVPAKEHATAA